MHVVRCCLVKETIAAQDISCKPDMPYDDVKFQVRPLHFLRSPSARAVSRRFPTPCSNGRCRTLRFSRTLHSTCPPEPSARLGSNPGIRSTASENRRVVTRVCVPVNRILISNVFYYMTIYLDIKILMCVAKTQYTCIGSEISEQLT